jgi:hypothetical protein
MSLGSRQYKKNHKESIVDDVRECIIVIKKAGLMPLPFSLIDS